VRVLLVEDDDAFAEPLVKGLGLEGFEVRRVATGAEAIAAGEADVVLLDIGLPDLDGYEVCRRIRARSDVAILVLSARSAENDRVLGLELGADDYIVKPFGLAELVARIGAVSRRRVGATTRPVRLRVGDLEVDPRTHQVVLAGRPVEVTPTEFKLLALLATDPGAVLERQFILEQVWGHPWYGPTKTLDVHVASLRRKLGDPGWVEAVRGIGFRLAPRP
jgi:two-component system response regulator RegX3